MLEIKPVSSPQPILKLTVIKKEDEHPPKRQPLKPKPAQDNRKRQQPAQHIDEIV
jgi:hypothetical protein